MAERITTQSPASERKTQLRGRRSARKLLDTALTLFLEKGVEHTTIDEIVDAAGLSKGTFYHHYESKAALLDALRANFKLDFQLHIDSALADFDATDYSARLNAWVKAAVENYLVQAKLLTIVFNGPEFQVWSARSEPFMDNFIALLSAGASAGHWHVPFPELTATFIFRGILGAIDDALSQGGDTAEQGAQLAELVSSLLKK